MKGLFLKDFRYLLLQKSFFGLILIIGLALSLTMGDSYYFVLGYLTFMGSLLGFITITMDDQTNGMAFLFTLPISRKQYVTEKYLFSILVMLFSSGVSLAAVFLTRWIKHYTTPPSEILFAALGCCACLIFFLSLMLPLTLKFNEERARLAYLISLGAFIVAIVPIITLINFLNTTHSFSLLWLISTEVWLMLGTFIILLCLVISYRISLRILEHRDF